MREETRTISREHNGEETATRHLEETFGVRYFEPGACEKVEARPDNLYFYSAYVGPHELSIERGDSVFWLVDGCTQARVARGPCRVTSKHLATVVRGYMCEDRTTSLHCRAMLPYVNGCSSKQLFAPERPGDPTLQLLDIPPHSAEQVHHTHSTVRVVYVLRGRGTSVVGMDRKSTREELYAGKVCILEPMCPHHFETENDHLVCAPLHIFSSVESESTHPMFLGTHRIRS